MASAKQTFETQLQNLHMQLEKSKIIVNSHKRDKDESEQKLKEALEYAKTQKIETESQADERLRALQTKVTEYENTLK